MTAFAIADVGRLEAFVVYCLRSAGMPSDPASTSAQVMIRATIRGNDHGVHLLPLYLHRLGGGAINASAEPRLLRDGVGTSLMDGDGGLGQYVAAIAMQHAVHKAKRVGCATVLVRNSNHLGAPGIYALMCAEAGLLGFVYTHGPLAIRVTGGKGPGLSSGARAFGIPSRGSPIVLDIAMAVAGSKIRAAAERDVKIPLGWLEDAEGRPTTDPGEYLRGGARVPIGEHKGYGLALVGEIFAGALAGADLAWSMGSLPMFSETSRQNTGHAMVVIDPQAFMSAEEFLDRIDEIMHYIRNLPLAPDSDRILIPGERAGELERSHRVHGIAFDERDWKKLGDAALSVGAQGLLEEARMN